MKKLVYVATITLLSCAPFAASAGDTTGNPGNGNQGCGYYSFDVWKNPGKVMQYIKETYGENPKEFLENHTIVDDPQNVGEYIAGVCNHPS